MKIFRTTLVTLLLALLAIGSWGDGHAAIALVASSQFNNHAAGATSVAVTRASVTPGDFIPIIVIGSSTAAPSSIVDSAGNTLHADIAWQVVASGGVSFGFGIYHVENASGGSHTFTLTVSASENLAIFGAEYSGVAAASALDTASAIATSTTTAKSTASITPTQNGDLVLFAISQ